MTTEAIHGVPSVWMTGCGRRDIRLLEFLVKLRARVRSRLLIDCATVIWRDSVCILIGLVGFSTATHRKEISGRKEGRHPARRRLSAHNGFVPDTALGHVLICFDVSDHVLKISTCQVQIYWLSFGVWTGTTSRV